MLPDVALLEIFDFYMYRQYIEAWQTLVHVCRKWRTIIFKSPRRLDLRLRCTARTPVRETLYVWPLLPIVVWGVGDEVWGVDGIMTALEHSADRISQIDLEDLPSSQLEQALEEMQRPFPGLTRLYLQAGDDEEAFDIDTFLGGSAPLLRTLWLDGVPFPELPKLLLSCTHLVDLDLRKMPDSGYISPEAMVTGLSALTRLESLQIEFYSPESRPDRKGQRPPTRTPLPSLTLLQFRGCDRYLEDLAARIDAPLLGNLEITFFHPLISDTPHLTQLISRTPKLKTHNQARVVFYSCEDAWVTLPQTFDGKLRLGSSCCRSTPWSDSHVRSLAQICRSSLPRTLLPAVENLYILERFPQLPRADDIDSSRWLEILHPFTAVTGLYIASALQGLIGEKVTKVLPALRTIFLETMPVPEAIRRFVAVRQLAGHPIAISHWRSDDVLDEYDGFDDIDY
jgi:hypothetical protein